VFFCIFAFFGVVALVNAIMIRAAVTTFGGVETESSYKAGLAFSREEAAAAAQAKRHWTVMARILPAPAGQFRLDVTALDANGWPLAGYSASARLAHPTDARRDHRIEMTIVSPGRYTALAEAAAGQWDLMIDLIRGEERLFRSRERIVLPEVALR
jgi:nitrogen fixation protein FixH